VEAAENNWTEIHNRKDHSRRISTERKKRGKSRRVGMKEIARQNGYNLTSPDRSGTAQQEQERSTWLRLIASWWISRVIQE